MKAKTLLTACLFMLAVGANAANDGKAILHHDKKPTAIYDADKLSDALSAAVAGDTIYLSAGTFPTFTLEKAITIKGAGTNTKISNGVIIDIPGSPTLTSSLLEAVEVNGAITVKSDMTNFLIKMVKTYDLQFANQQNTNALVDRCYLDKFTITSTMTDFYVRNSYIWNLTSTSLKFNKCNFINCRIQGDWNKAAGRFINCELGRIENYLTIKSSILSYSLVYSYDNYLGVDHSTYQEKVYFDDTSAWLSVDDRLNKGYICKDGTVVGVEGGKTPYSLTPSGPKETSSTVKVSDSEKKLNVSINVSPK